MSGFMSKNSTYFSSMTPFSSRNKMNIKKHKKTISNVRLQRDGTYAVGGEREDLIVDWADCIMNEK